MALLSPQGCCHGHHLVAATLERVRGGCVWGLQCVCEGELDVRVEISSRGSHPCVWKGPEVKAADWPGLQ